MKKLKLNKRYIQKQDLTFIKETQKTDTYLWKIDKKRIDKILLNKENLGTYEHLYELSKSKYNFKSKIITCDFW